MWITVTTKYTESILVVLREPVPPFNEVEVKKNDRGRINHANRLYFWWSNGVTIEGTRYPGPGEQPVTITLELAGISVTGTAAFNAFSAPLKNL
jgi:hypothetical protein